MWQNNHLLAFSNLLTTSYAFHIQHQRPSLNTCYHVTKLPQFLVTWWHLNQLLIRIFFLEDVESSEKASKWDKIILSHIIINESDFREHKSLCFIHYRVYLSWHFHSLKPHQNIILAPFSPNSCFWKSTFWRSNTFAHSSWESFPEILLN